MPKLIFAGSFLEGAPNLVQRIDSQTSSYIVCFNFYVQQFKSFILDRDVPDSEFTRYRISGKN